MTAQIIEGVVATFDLTYSQECECESTHTRSTCSVHVRWSAPPFPCGCLPRRLVCQAHRDLAVSDFQSSMWGERCAYCGTSSPMSEWITGWYLV